MNLTKALDAVFTTGRYKGKRVGEVWYTDRSYVLTGDISMNDEAANAVMLLRAEEKKDSEAEAPAPRPLRTLAEAHRTTEQIVGTREALIRAIASEIQFASTHRHYGFIKQHDNTGKAPLPDAPVIVFGERQVGYRAYVRIVVKRPITGNKDSSTPPVDVATVVVSHTDVDRFKNVFPVNIPVREADLESMLSAPAKWISRFFPDIKEGSRLEQFAPPDRQTSLGRADVEEEVS